MKSIVDRISVLGSAIIACTQQVLLPQFVLLVFKTNDRLIRYYPGFGRAVEEQGISTFLLSNFLFPYCMIFSKVGLKGLSTTLKNPLIWSKKIWKMYQKIAY